MQRNVVSVTVDQPFKNEYSTRPLYMYDFGMQLFLQIEGINLPETVRAEFCNAGDDACLSPAVPIVDGAVAIPNGLLETGSDVHVYVVDCQADSRTTLFRIVIPVKGRPPVGT